MKMIKFTNASLFFARTFSVEDFKVFLSLCKESRIWRLCKVC